MPIVPVDLDDYLARLHPHRRQRTRLRLSLCTCASNCVAGTDHVERVADVESESAQ